MIFSSSWLLWSIFRCKYYLWHCNCYNIWLNLPCLFQSLNQRSRAIFCTLNPNCFGKLVLLSWKVSKIYGWHLEIGKMVRMLHKSRKVHFERTIFRIALFTEGENIFNPLCSRNFQKVKLRLDFVEIWSFYRHSNFTPYQMLANSNGP